jgi:acetyltransferase-like isoleucine patch superfamily enzyme
MMKIVFFNLGLLLSYLFPHNTLLYICRLRKKIYSGWISRGFKSFGQQSTLYGVRTLIGAQYISIGNFCSIGNNAILTAWSQNNNETFRPSIIIGDGCVIGNSAHITAINNITIGNNLLTGNNLLITDNAHGFIDKSTLNHPPITRSLISKGSVIIGNNVWIGSNVSILPDVHIGNGCVIGTGSVVTKNLPDYSVVVGVPAKIIKSF